MDYFGIGQRIRKYRKASNLSQEQMAEQIGISVTHMSHIETGNTKLSLTVLVKIAELLSVQVDTLIYADPQVNKTSIKQEVSEILDHCTERELNVIMDIVRSTKTSIDKYYE